MTEKIFTIKSPLGYNIVCSDTTWSEHIQTSHAMMSENIEAVKDAVGNPMAVYQSAEWPNRDVYFGKSSQATYGNLLYTKVVVVTPDEYNEEGDVVSAWPQRNISGNIGELRANN